MSSELQYVLVYEGHLGLQLTIFQLFLETDNKLFSLLNIIMMNTVP